MITDLSQLVQQPGRLFLRRRFGCGDHVTVVCRAVLTDMHVRRDLAQSPAPRDIGKESDDLLVGVASKDHSRRFARRFPSRLHNLRIS